jgi:hypothetical protein
MGAVLSAIEQMVLGEVDDRDLNLAVMMIREHHALYAQAKHLNTQTGGTHSVVPWEYRAHKLPDFPDGGKWDVIYRILNDGARHRLEPLHEDGTMNMLHELKMFEYRSRFDPTLMQMYEPPGSGCIVCDGLSQRNAVDWDGPISTAHFMAEYGAQNTLPDRNFSLYGDNTGIGNFNRRVTGRF